MKNVTSISLQELYEKGLAKDNKVDLKYGHIIKTTSENINYYDLYDRSNNLVCMDGEIISFEFKDHGTNYQCINENSGIIQKFTLTKSEFETATFE